MTSETAKNLPLPKDYLLAGAAVVISFVVYLVTLVPGVFEGDSGELITAIYNLGVAHPTGFPLFMLLGKLWTIIFPIGEIAYRLNVFSAIFASFTVGMSYLILRNLNLSRLVSFSASLTLAFASTLWSHATALRVYSITAFFAALIIFLAIRWRESKKDKYIYWISLISGFGAGLHLTFLLAPLFVLLLVLLEDRTVFKKPKLIIFSLLLFVLPLAQYLYIPIRAAADPIPNWNNPRTLENFIYYITQRDYAGKIGTRTAENFLSALWLTFKLFFFEFTAAGLPLAAWGLAKFWKRHKKFFLALLVIIIGNVAIMQNYGNEEDIIVLYRYFLPSFLVITIFIAFGLESFIQILQKKPSSRLKLGLPILICLILPLVAFGAHLQKSDRRNNYIVENYSKNIFLSVEPNAILLTVGDAVSGVMFYTHSVKKERADVTTLDKELLTMDAYVNQQNFIERANKNSQQNYQFSNIITQKIMDSNPKERFVILISENIDRRRIFSTFNSEPLIKAKYKYIPRGLVFEIAKKETKEDIEEVKKVNDALWAKYDLRGLIDPAVYKGDFMVAEIVEQYSKSRTNLGAYYFNNGEQEYGLREFETALKFEPNNFMALYNLYRVYENLGEIDKANNYLSRAKSINPNFFTDSPQFKTGQIRGEYLMGDEPWTYYQLGVRFGLEKKYEKAAEAFKAAIELDPYFSLAYFNLGNVYGLRSNWRQAAENFEKAIQFDPNLKTAYLNLGDIYANYLQDKEEAIRYLQKYLEIAPDAEDGDKVEEVIRLLSL